MYVYETRILYLHEYMYISFNKSMLKDRYLTLLSQCLYPPPSTHTQNTMVADFGQVALSH